MNFVEYFRFRDGATINVLADALDDLRSALKSIRAISFSGDSRDVIIYAAELLGPCKYFTLGRFFFSKTV